MALTTERPSKGTASRIEKLRPILKGGGTARLNVDISREEMRRLKHLAADRGVTLASLVRGVLVNIE